MTKWDWAILAAFIMYALYAGFRERTRASQNLDEYFLAGRSLSGWKAGLSMAATQFAADTPLLVTGLIATAGIFALWRLWIYALAFLLMGFLLAPSWRRVGVLTDAELTEVRYGHRAAAALRGIKAIYFGTIVNCTVPWFSWRRLVWLSHFFFGINGSLRSSLMYVSTLFNGPVCHLLLGG
jgi:Na+/proline symporter